MSKFTRKTYQFILIALANALIIPSIAQDRDFSEVIEEVRKGFNDANQEILHREDDVIYKDSSIEMDNGENVFYIILEDSKLKNLSVGLNAGEVSEQEIIKQIEKSTNVKLEKLDLSGMAPYLIKEKNTIIGLLGFYLDDELQILQFYRHPGVEIEQSINEILSKLEPNVVDQYIGDLVKAETSTYTSFYKAKVADASYFVKTDEYKILYHSYKDLIPKVWVNYFDKELQPFKNVGFSNIEFLEETTNNNTRVSVYSAEKEGTKYRIEITADRFMGIANLGSVSKKIETKVEMKEEPENKYPAPPSFRSHSGVYNGVGLVDLIGRHIEDPAVQAFFKQTNSVETYKGGDGFYSYDGKDISTSLFKNRIVEITIGNTYDWPYNTPKDSVTNISQSTLAYEETFSPYVNATKDGVEFMLYFDEETKRITEFVIRKE